ncbi:MAG TPA: O-antigen ligase family protein [Edaphobacter sp.]|nr:O-antigen ligase family protein [Edaphobacter sp.]
MLIIALMQSVIIIALIVSGRRRLENALPLFCFFLTLMPLEAKLVIPGLFDINIMRVSLLTLLGLFLVKRKKASREKLPLINLMYMHVAWALCSTMYSLSFATSIKQLLAQLIEFYLMYYLLVHIITNIETIHKMLYAMMMAIGICCIFSIFEVYASWSVLRIFPASNWITYNGGLDPLYSELGRGLRVRSTFPHPILFGDALAISIILSLYLLGYWAKGKRRLFLWMSLILMFWSIYKTQSRGPWLATIVCCFLLFLMVKREIRKYLITAAVMALIVLLARPGVWQSIDALYQASTDPTQPVGTSYLYRHALADSIEQAVQKEPGRFLLGYGLGTFRVLGLEVDFLGEHRRWYTCDNNWASFLYETGYGGLLLIGALLFWPLILAFRNYWKLPKPESTLSGVLFISIAGFYFLMVSVAAYSWGQQGYMNWILISMSISLPMIARKRQRAIRESRKLDGGGQGNPLDGNLYPSHSLDGLADDPLTETASLTSH